MLITTARATPIAASVAGFQTFSSSGASSAVTFSGTYAPTTGDLVAVLWLASNVIDVGMTVGLNWGGAAGPAFAQQGFLGTQGAGNRAFVWIGTLRGVATTAASPYYSCSRVSGFSDPCLFVASLANWGGGIGLVTGLQTTTSASSVARTFTPRSGNSLLVGGAGCFVGTAAPFTVTGATKDAEQASGAGATTVDGSACFFHASVVTPASQTITAASGTSDPNWAIGIAELY